MDAKGIDMNVTQRTRLAVIGMISGSAMLLINLINQFWGVYPS